MVEKEPWTERTPWSAVGGPMPCSKGTITQVQLAAEWSFLSKEAAHNSLGSQGLIHMGEPCFWGTGDSREHPSLAFLLIELRVPWLLV